MTAFEKYELWLKMLDDSAARAELETIRENENDDNRPILHRPGIRHTAGLRGVTGIGTNRMNKYTVSLAAQGLAMWLLENNRTKRVVISRDPRHFSEEFARISAAVLAANGISVYIFRDISRTPLCPLP
jgi:phosphoglucomutase